MPKKWKGDQKCSFYDSNETIQHLFFVCHVADNVWRIINIATGLNKPNSIRHISGDWLRSRGLREKRLIIIRMAAIFC